MKRITFTLILVFAISLSCFSQFFEISTGLSLQTMKFKEARNTDAYTQYPDLSHTERYSSLSWDSFFFRSSIISAIFNDSKFLIGDYEGGGIGFGRTFEKNKYDLHPLSGDSHFNFFANLDYGFMTRFRFSESGTVGLRFYFHWDKNRMRLQGHDGFDCPALLGLFGQVEKIMFGVDLNLKKDQQEFDGNWLNIEAKYKIAEASHIGIKLNFVNYELNYPGNNYPLPREKKFTDIEVLYGFSF